VTLGTTQGEAEGVEYGNAKDTSGRSSSVCRPSREGEGREAEDGGGGLVGCVCSGAVVEVRVEGGVTALNFFEARRLLSIT